MTIDPSLQDWIHSDTHHIMDKLSDNQFAFHKVVYRGLEDRDRLKDIDFKSLGNHWSTNHHVASEFANPSWAADAADSGDIPGTSGSIITGRVANHHIIGYGTPEHKKFEEEQSSDDIFSPEHFEKERTVRPGAPVEVLGITKQAYSPKKGWTNTDFKRFPKKATA